MQTELFDVGERAEKPPTGRRGYPANYPPKAHPTPARPGTGPIGETCAGCIFCVRVKYHNKRFIKCERVKWTHGPGTDIRAGWPACSEWLPAADHEPLALTPPGFTTAEVREAPLIAADWWEEAGYQDKAAKLREMANG